MAKRRKRPYTPDAPEWDNWIVTLERILDDWKLLVEHIQARGGMAALLKDWPEARKVDFARRADAFGDDWHRFVMALYAECETIDISKPALDP